MMTSEKPTSAASDASIHDMIEEAHDKGEEVQVLVADDEGGDDYWMLMIPEAQGFAFFQRPTKGVQTIPPDADVSDAIDFVDAEKFLIEE